MLWNEHMKSKLILSTMAALVMASSLTACTTTAQNTAEPILPVGSWKEHGITTDTKPLTILINDEGRLSASAGCNRLIGQASMDGNTLKVDQLASTRMMCYDEDAEREEELTQLLTNFPQVNMVNKQLQLTLDEESYLFDLQPDMSKGVTKFIYVASQKAPCNGVRPMECLQIRESKDEPWQLYYGDIEDFEFKPGVTYRLRIKEFDVENPPADASSKRWILNLIVEQNFKPEAGE